MKLTLARRAVAKFLGTGFLVAAVVGSGIMGERLAAGNVAIALLANTLVTGAVRSLPLDRARATCLSCLRKMWGS